MILHGHTFYAHAPTCRFLKAMMFRDTLCLAVFSVICNKDGLYNIYLLHLVAKHT